MTSCQAQLDCSPPGYSPRRLLIIVNWSVNWFACVNRIRQLVCLRPEQQLHFLSYTGSAALANVRYIESAEQSRTAEHNKIDG